MVLFLGKGGKQKKVLSPRQYFEYSHAKTCQTHRWLSYSGPFCLGFAVRVVWEPYRPVVQCTLTSSATIVLCQYRSNPLGDHLNVSATWREEILLMRSLSPELSEFSLYHRHAVTACVCVSVWRWSTKSDERQHHPPMSLSFKTVINGHKVSCTNA